jgi:hypothetical protein
VENGGLGCATGLQRVIVTLLFCFFRGVFKLVNEAIGMCVLLDMILVYKPGYGSAVLIL